MELKTYQARSMSDALSKVKRELGKGAMILHTRTIQRGGVLGLGAKNFVEITATADPRVIAARVAAPREAPASVPPSPPVTSSDRLSPATSPAPLHDDIREELTAIRTMVRDLLRQAEPSRQPDVPEDLLEHYTQLISHEVAESIVMEIVDRARRDNNVRNAALPTAASPTGASPVVGDDESSPTPTATLLREELVHYISEMLPPAVPLQLVNENRPTIVALVGPTGVGKTTTLAKLAAHMKLREGRSVGLITIDSYRIAAVEQLKTYAQILQIPIIPVVTPQEIVGAIEKLAAVDVILIDTAGRSQKDDPRITELKQFLDAARPDQVHLVLSTTAREAAIRQAIEKFGVLGARQLIFTKLDEAVGFGVILNVLRSVDLRLSYLTTGQSVPDDIEVGSARRVAELLLGAELAAGNLPPPTETRASDATPTPCQGGQST